MDDLKRQNEEYEKQLSEALSRIELLEQLLTRTLTKFYCVTLTAEIRKVLENEDASN